MIEGKEFFKEEDLRNIAKQFNKNGYMSHGAGDMWEPDYRTEDAAKELNAKLSDYILIPKADFEKSKVFGNIEFGWWQDEPCDPKDDNWQHTHTANLINIKPIEKKECVHEPQIYSSSNPVMVVDAVYPKCKLCGVALVARWEVV